MAHIHILRTPMVQGKWERTTSRVRWLRGCTVVAECCACRMPARETEIRSDIVDPKSHHAPYYGPTRHLRCAPGFGCTVAPWRRQGKEAREGWIEAWFEGRAPFIRLRDGARLEFSE
jgi:hypothetical protein